MLTCLEAEELIREHLPCPRKEKIPLSSGLGYVLAESIYACRDHPPFHRAIRDGIAIDFNTFNQGRRDFRVEKYARAGFSTTTLDHKDHAVEIATGAPLPAGANTIVPYEEIRIENGIATIVSPNNVQRGNGLHFQGSDGKKGDLLLKEGEVIDIPAIAILASNGVSHPVVFGKPKIGILTTGDELVHLEGDVLPHQIYRSNDITLASLLRHAGINEVDVAWTQDHPELIREKLLAWQEKDIILITGGVSKGKHDEVPQVLESMNVKKVFHQVAQRPGRPLWFGTDGKGQLVFGLPGNPASCLTCLVRYVLPAIAKISGKRVSEGLKRPLAASKQPHDTLALFIPVAEGEEGAKFYPLSTNGSGDFISLKNSRGFVELSPRKESYEPGEMVPFYEWSKGCL